MQLVGHWYDCCEGPPSKNLFEQEFVFRRTVLLMYPTNLPIDVCLVAELPY